MALRAVDRTSPSPTRLQLAEAAFEQVAAEWSGPRAAGVLATVRRARETRRLESGRAAAILSDIIDLAGYLHRRAAALT